MRTCRDEACLTRIVRSRARKFYRALLEDLGADVTLTLPNHSLYHTSKYRLHSQGDHADTETTTGIKQGCKLGPTLFCVLTRRLLHSLIQGFGWDTVQKFLTGYPDDFTMHRTTAPRTTDSAPARGCEGSSTSSQPGKVRRAGQTGRPGSGFCTAQAHALATGCGGHPAEALQTWSPQVMPGIPLGGGASNIWASRFHTATLGRLPCGIA